MDYEKVILDLYDRVIELEKRLNDAERKINLLSGNGVSCEKFMTVNNNGLTKTGAKDITKYLFEGKCYGKSRLVLAVVKAYVNIFKINSFGRLDDAFDSSLQGSFGVLARERDLLLRYEGKPEEMHRRYFDKENEVILVGEEKVCVCNQWGISNINKFITYVNSIELFPKITSI